MPEEASLYAIPGLSGVWVVEDITRNSFFIYKVKKVLEYVRSKYQEICVTDTHDFGLALMLDGRVQFTERDEAVYHESLVHPVMLAHESPERVLIVGGGDGLALREVLKHSCVKRAELVDLDEAVIEVCRRHFRKILKGAFEDSRVRVHISDGRLFLEKAPQNHYDVVVLDLTDPLGGGPEKLLYTVEFYKLVRRVLKEGGLMATQATSPFYPKVFGSIVKTVKEVFPSVSYHLAFVPSYSLPWAFVVAGEELPELTAEEAAKRLKERGVSLRYFSPEIIASLRAWATSPKLARMVEEAKVATDASPLPH